MHRALSILLCALCAVVGFALFVAVFGPALATLPAIFRAAAYLFAGAVLSAFADTLYYSLRK